MAARTVIFAAPYPAACLASPTSGKSLVTTMLRMAALGTVLGSRARQPAPSPRTPSAARRALACFLIQATHAEGLRPFVVAGYQVWQPLVAGEADDDTAGQAGCSWRRQADDAIVLTGEQAFAALNQAIPRQAMQ